MKTRNIVLYAILLIAGMVLAGCAGESEPTSQEQNVEQAPVCAETVKIIVECAEETEGAAVEPTEDPTCGRKKPYLTQIPSKELVSVRGDDGHFFDQYLFYIAACLEFGESYQIKYWERGASEGDFDVDHPFDIDVPRYDAGMAAPYLLLEKDKEYEAKLQILYHGLAAESDTILLSGPTAGWQFDSRGIVNFVKWPGIMRGSSLDTIQTEEGVEESVIRFWTQWDVCFESGYFPLFEIRPIGNEDKSTWETRDLVVSDEEWASSVMKMWAPDVEGEVYEGRLSILDLTTQEIVETSEWIELPTRADTVP